MASYKFFVPGCHTACGEVGRESNATRSPNFNINRASWLPGILKRQKFKWTSLPVKRRPESPWKMSYGYFWRAKCSVLPQGKPWIAGVGITWKEGLADALGTWHWRSGFCSQCHRSPSEETVQKDSCILLVYSYYRGEEDIVKKKIFSFAISIIWICVDFWITWLATRPRCIFSPPNVRVWVGRWKRE